MPWALIAAAAAAGTASSFTDWLFMGVLFHNRYNTYPEVWWPGIRSGNDRGAILWSCAIGYITAGALVALCAFAGAATPWDALALALLAWAAGPMVLLVTNGLFIKFDPLLTASHAAGWLVRFSLAGLAAGFALS